MAARLLTADQLAAHCDLGTLSASLATAGHAAPETAASTAAAHGPAGTPARTPHPPVQGAVIVGQDRAREAVRFGVSMSAPGYHLFVMGPAGAGKRSLVRSTIAAHLSHNGIHRSDWVYVHNFEKPHQPIALRLSAGGGAVLRADMRALVEELRATIPAAFDSEEYASSLERLNTDLKERAEQALQAVGAEAQRRGLVMIRTPVGFSFAPRKGDEVMSTQDFEALPSDERERLQKALLELQDQLLHALRASMRLSKEHAERLRTLNHATTQLAVDHAVAETQARHADQPEVLRHLEAVRRAVIENADAFRSREDSDASGQQGELSRYEVNLVVDVGGSDGNALIEADLPSYQNLIGRIDHVAHFGTLLTDFRHIKAGELHRANGGFLMVDALRLLSQPFAWAALKRALLRREILIESVAEMISLVSTVQLEPQPIPLDVKVVLVGDRSVCQMLQAYDPEFEQLFRVVADLDDDLPREPAIQGALAATLAAQAQAAGLRPPGVAALARLVDHSARRSGDATRLDAGVRHLLDLLREADHLARLAQPTGLAAAPGAEIEAAHVVAAIAARRARAGAPPTAGGAGPRRRRARGPDQCHGPAVGPGAGGPVAAVAAPPIRPLVAAQGHACAA